MTMPYVSARYAELQREKAKIDAQHKALIQKTTELNHQCCKCDNGKTLEENMDVYYAHLKEVQALKERSRQLGGQMMQEQERAAAEKKAKQDALLMAAIPKAAVRKPQDRTLVVVKTDTEKAAIKRCEHLENKYAALKEAVFEVCGERVYNQVLQKADSIDFGRGADFGRMMRK